LKHADDGPRLLVCIICQRPEDGPRRMDVPRSGGKLLAEVRALAADDPRLSALSIEPAPCLYNCNMDCSAHLRAPGKPGLMLERLEPGPVSARAVLDYAAAYMASAGGVVAEAARPPALEGHIFEWVPGERYLG
jgi:predicted metal-binding protein